MKPSEREIDLMRHARGHPKMYRNYFAATPGTDADRDWTRLVEAGLAWRGELINSPPNQLQLYHVTEDGDRALAKARGE